MLRNQFFLLTTFLLLLTSPVFATLDNRASGEANGEPADGNVLSLVAEPRLSKGHLSAIYGGNSADRFLGISGDYERKFKGGDWEIEGQLQRGDITQGDFYAAVAFNMWKLQIKPFAELNTVQMDDWGYTTDGGMKTKIPIGDTGVAVAFGAFLRGSNAFVPLQTGTRNPVTGEIKWEDPTLLNFDNLGLVNGIVEVPIEWRRLDIKLTSIIDISNQRFHQFITSVTYSKQITESLQFSAMGEHIAEAGKDGADGGQQADFSLRLGYTLN